MPLFFGPEYSKFQEAVDLVEEGAAFPVSSTTELSIRFRKQYDDSEKATRVSREYVQRNIGATAKVMQVVERLKRGTRQE